MSDKLENDENLSSFQANDKTSITVRYVSFLYVYIFIILYDSLYKLFLFFLEKF